MTEQPIKCPDCGAEVSEHEPYRPCAGCGRVLWADGSWTSRPFTCYLIAQLKAENERLRLIEDAIDNSGLDISPCRGCGEPVVCLPDGMSDWCAECADAAKLAMADLLKHDPVVNAAAQAVMDADGVVFDPEEGDK